ETININDNNISFNQYGILSLINQANISNNFLRNVLTGGSSPTNISDGLPCSPTGILVFDWPSNFTGGLIKENRISIRPRATTPSNGIAIASGSSYHINDNIISLNCGFPTEATGIRMYGATGNYL